MRLGLVTLLCGLLLATQPAFAKVNVLFVGAHPDDESMVAATLARLVGQERASVAIVTATRGEGGSNAVGHEYGRPLGALREAEQRAALHELGVEDVRYLDLVDFGYTASAEETARAWGHNAPLEKLVQLYRDLQPDIVITLPPWPAGHGHHQYVGRLATEAFFAAATSSKKPASTWQAKQLYYALEPEVSGGRPNLPASLVGWRPSERFAKLKERSIRAYRSQGWDQPGVATVPLADETESLLRAVSLAPVSHDESSLLSDTNFTLDIQSQSGYLVRGQPQKLHLAFASPSPLQKLELSLSAPKGWEVKRNSSMDFTVQSLPDASDDALCVLHGHFQGIDRGGQRQQGDNYLVLPARPAVSIELVPNAAVRDFRQWAHQLGLERLAAEGAVEVVIGAHRTAMVQASVSNQTARTADVEVLVERTDLHGATHPRTLRLAPRSSAIVDFPMAAPAEPQQQTLPLQAQVRCQDVTVTDRGFLQVVPSIDIQRFHGPTPFVMDCDVTKYRHLQPHAIPFDRVWGGSVTSPADLSGEFVAAYDDKFLYLGIKVNDDVVVSNIEPTDLRALWRSDSIEVALDPKPQSESTATTFKIAVVPFDTSGKVKGARSNDMRPGPAELTAPGLGMAAMRTKTGYFIEMALPRAVALAGVEPGKPFGFNLMIYDCDKANARPGENCNKGRIAWSAWPGVAATPRLWGQALLVP